MLTHTDECTCFCHCTVPVMHPPATIQCLLCVKHAGYSHIKTYNIEISRDNCKAFMAHPAKNITTAGERETWTRNTLGFFTPAHGSLYAPWISKNGFPSPYTPPRPAYMHCAFVPEWALLYLFTTGTKTTTAQACQTWWKAIVYCRSCVLQLVLLPSMYCKWLAERKTPLCGLYVLELSCERKPKTVVEMVVLDKIWGCDHTYILFNLVQIMQGWDTLFRFASSLWKFINELNGCFYLLQHTVVEVSISSNLWIQSKTDLWRTYLNPMFIN